ncbi:membrane protein [Intrasporangium oryzae NRRL B-24470]|uniref:Membrane protein n=1 Tax=Intrasporangium oryzae NRRL B-24470 TaxID=1386089 RepID=W9G6J2_9MICO|nr:SHOCT domain-containing protein [Intrasporangium oryzae]EWT00428.1 membrane protein [Intrasporangium oryzae NRRL B-24470]
MSFWDIVWFIFIFAAFMAYLMVVFTILGDLFRDDSVSGVMKAVWVILLFVFPFITALVYIIARGKGMNERARQEAVEAKKAQDEYIRSVAAPAAGGGGSPADQIARAKELLDSGAITSDEFAALKAKALG